MGKMISLGKGICEISDTDVSDSDLRQAVANLPNGKYTTMICRGCGGYQVEQDGNHETAKIVSRCKGCFIPE